MAEKPFKYILRFPDPESPREEDDVRNSFEIIQRAEAENRTPVVVLLGWAGCQEKHLAKYSTMYEKKGYIILQVMVPAKTFFFQAHKVIDVAHGLMDLLNANGITDNPIIFHVFSNGGSMIYSHLTSLLNKSESGFHEMLSVRGVIFDSTPGKPRMLNGVRAFMSTLQTNPILRLILGFCLLLYMVVSRILVTLLPFTIQSGQGFQMYNSICEDPSKCPQLFLFSKGDKVIMAEDVEEVIEQRKKRGVDVKSICWEDSAHVAHLRTHPEVYTKACLDFVANCLERSISANKL